MNPGRKFFIVGGRPKSLAVALILVSLTLFLTSPGAAPAAGTWSETGASTPQIRHTATLLTDRRVLAAGGAQWEGSPNALARAELYDPLNLVVNGSFETASVDPGTGFITLPAGSGDIAHWTVLGAGIDYNGGYWRAAEGSRSLDLNALDAGTIWQTIETSPGSYLVSFAMAGNPDGRPVIKSLRVILGGKSQDFFFDASGMSRDNMGWTTKSCIFPAEEGGSKALIFQSLTSGPYGPALDRVRVIRANPMPPMLQLLLD